MIKILLLIFPFLIFANEINILSKTQKDILKTKEKIIHEDRKIDEKSWLSNMNLNLSIDENSDDITNKTISLNYEQNIFKFGGIGYMIDLAKVKEQYNLLKLNMDYKDFLNKIFTTVLSIKIQELNIKKIKLKLKNQNIAIKIKQDEYNKGETNIVTLNDKIIAKSSLEEELINQQITFIKSVDELKKYSNISYDEIKTPSMETIELKNYMKNSDIINLANKNMKIAELNYKIKKRDFLPKLYFTFGGGYKDIDDSKNDGKYYSYGLKISMPLDFSFSNKIEKTRLNLLLSNQEKEQSKIDEKIEFKKISQDIEKYKNLINIALNDIKLYAQLLDITKQEYRAGYKAKEDVEILSNTKKTRELDIKLYNLYLNQQVLKYYY